MAKLNGCDVFWLTDGYTILYKVTTIGVHRWLTVRGLARCDELPKKALVVKPRLSAGVVMQNQSQWFVIRTMPRKETLAFNELRLHVREAFLPLFRTSVPVYGRLAWVRAPLFPCYLFARFTVDAIFKVRNTRGVRGIVSSGDEPSVVPDSILNDLKARCLDGMVELRPPRFEPSEPVEVKLGIFRCWDAIFDPDLYADERVEIMLRAVETTGMPVVLPACSIGKA